MTAASTAGPPFDIAPRSGWREYVVVTIAIAAITGVGLIVPESYYVSVGLIYLLAVIALSLRVGRGPMLAAGIMSAVVWEYIFIPPKFAFAINSLQDLLLFVTYFVVAVVAGELTARIRTQAYHEQVREQRATALFHFTRALAEARTLTEVIASALHQTNQLFGCQSSVAIVPESTAGFFPQFSGTFVPAGQDLAAAARAYVLGEPAGRFTLLEPQAEGYFLPLIREGHALGVFAIKMPPGTPLTKGQKDLLDAFARQLALMVERDHLRAASEREKILAESDKLHRALLEGVSHELRTPLAVIAATSENLLDAGLGQHIAQVEEIRSASLRLNRVVGNLLDQTRLESGALRPRMDTCNVCDLVNSAVEATAEAYFGHTLLLTLPEEDLYVRADFALTEQALINLLLNAALYTPSGTEVFVAAGLATGGDQVQFTVTDQGPGIPAEMRERIFKKFTRGTTAAPGGLGLGLSIVYGFITAQGGQVTMNNCVNGGAEFTFYLPAAKLEPPPPE